MKKKYWLFIISAAVLFATLLTVLILYLRPIQSIEITNDDIKHGEKLGKYAVVYFDSETKASYKIDYETSPAFLKNREVKFEYNGGEGVTVDENGLVTFTSAPYNDGTVNSIKIKLVAKNGRGHAEDNITVVARKK